MKAYSFYKFYFALVIAAICASITACSSEDIELEPQEESTSSEDADKLLKNATIEWGLSREEVIAHMSGYNQLSNTGTDLLQFTVPNSKQSISYQLYEGTLSATAIIMPQFSSELDLTSLLKGYTYIGELNKVRIYENRAQNTMATVWQAIGRDSSYNAIGFAPISSEAYETLQPITATTDANANADMFTATVSGSVSGVDANVEVGFIYGTTNNLSEYSENKVSTTSQNDFTLTINELIDNATYYYCAYAVVDDIYYLGEIKSFKTAPLTYTVDGKTFSMIHVEGGSMPDFSIMQTELPPNSNLQIGDISISKLNTNGDGGVTKAEFRSFLNSLREATGLPFRLPTTDEWEYAAHGGSKSKDYTYCGSNSIDDVAWYSGNSDNSTHEIAVKEPNELGLYDMSGNYSEVCNDKEDEYDVDGSLHGGSWNDDASACKWSSKKNGSVSGDIPGTNLKEKNAFNSKYITIRLVYSRIE